MFFVFIRFFVRVFYMQFFICILYLYIAVLARACVCVCARARLRVRVRVCREGEYIFVWNIFLF